MPQPTQSDLHQDAALSNISVAYVQDADNFIASKVSPVVPVSKQSDKYYIFTKADWFRDEVEKRADNTESAGSGYNLSTTTYFADVWALHKDIGLQARRNADAAVANLDRSATLFLTQRMLLRQEIEWVSEYFTTSVWDNDVTPTNLWSDYTSSDPINDVELGKETILKNTGFEPNTLILGYQVFRQLKHHPDLVDRVKYTSDRVLTEEAIARLFGVDKILVAKAVKNTANEGATASFDFTHGKHALLCFVNPTPGLMEPSAMYTFAWNGFNDMGLPVSINRLDMPLKKSTRIEIEAAWDNKVVASDLGYFFNGAVS